MLTGLKELTKWVFEFWQPGMPSGVEDYQSIEFTTSRHMHNPQLPSPLTYEEEARIKTIKFH
ncbi:hypothetical protein [Paenibacillus sp. NPDC057934]|uniref:hypothetical protein n=1 Tax=Paenibacillus sp. NPDC057934 TaxID=3346282 RepID=UPI0036DA3AFA